MVKLIFSSLLLISITFLANCRKEASISQELSSGKEAGISAFRVLSVLHIAEELGFKRKDGFFTAQTKRTTLDSIYSDGDGVEYELDFNQGITCTDGIKRKGKCRVQMLDSSMPATGLLEWRASDADSFQIQSNGAWVTVTGNAILHLVKPDSAALSFDLIFKNSDGTKRYIALPNLKVAVFYSQPIFDTKVAETWKGYWKTILPEGVLNVYTTQLVNNSGCRSIWNSGVLEIKDVEGVSMFSIDMDPIGNNACDLEFKVSQGKGLKTDEMVFKAW